MRSVLTSAERIFHARSAARRGRVAALAIAIFGAVALAFASTSCSEPIYTCTSNAQCISPSGAQGTCETTGYCAYPDTTCTTSSAERYSTTAAGGLANTCVAMPANACVLQLSVGLDFACYVRTDGTVWCWGNNSNGQLGDGTTMSRSSPTEVMGLPPNNPALEVEVAEYHACVKLTDGSIYCWGYNDQSNLGQCKGSSPDGGLTGSASPLQVSYATVTTTKDGGRPGDGGATAVWSCNGGPLLAAIPNASNGYGSTLTVGGEHTCVIDRLGSLLCWGENLSTPVGGQAGQDYSAFPSVEGPLVVTGSDSPALQQEIVVSVQAGDDYSCLLTGDGNVYCWGGNQDGELADKRKLAWSASPILVSLPSSVDSFSVDDETACALSSGTISCWGNGSTGIFGPATPPQPTANANSPLQLGTATAIFGGPNSETVFIENAAGTLQCWGANNNGQCALGSLDMINLTSPTTALLSSVAQLRVGKDHGCALTKAGELFCWGDNTYGELGIGTTSTTPSPTPARVPVQCN